jgi:hypothetical protein
VELRKAVCIEGIEVNTKLAKIKSLTILQS